MYMRTSDSSWHPEATHSILDKWQRRLNKPFLQNKRKAILNNVNTTHSTSSKSWYYMSTHSLPGIVPNTLQVSHSVVPIIFPI